MKTRTLIYGIVIILCVAGLGYLFSVQWFNKQYNGKWISLTEFPGYDAPAFSTIYFFDKNNGIGLATGVEVTDNSGKSWSTLLSYEDVSFSYLVFTEKQNGWLIGWEKGNPFVMKTKNKGMQWQTLSSDEKSLSEIYKNFTRSYLKNSFLTK